MRIRMCGSPAAPNRAPSWRLSLSSVSIPVPWVRAPGARKFSPTPLRRAAVPSSSLGFQPNFASTSTARKILAIRRTAALSNCTSVAPCLPLMAT